MKKFLAMLLAMVMALSLVACGETKTTDDSQTTDDGTAANVVEAALDTPNAEKGSINTVFDGNTDGLNKDVKIGIVLVGDENEGYTAAHMEGIKAAMATLGLTEDNMVWYYNIPEDETCYDTAIKCVEAGCNLIITNSYNHQTYAQQAASENPDVQFISATGDTAKTSGLSNFANAFNLTYESRYVSGVVAGMKIAEMIEAGTIAEDGYDADGNVKLGYVGAYPYAEVVSGYTAFYLGVKSIVSNVVMDVQYTNSWFSQTAEAETANALMNRGCVIIGQHADSTGAPSAVQEARNNGKNVYSIGYNIDMLAAAPTAALTSSTNTWSVFYTYAFSQLMKGEAIATNWAGGYEDGAVAITELGPDAAAGTQEKVDEVIAAIKDGSLHVFDTSTFTLGKCTDGSYATDENDHVVVACAVDTNGDYVYDTGNVVFDGYYHESYSQSAPSFTLRIDGITELN